MQPAFSSLIWMPGLLQKAAVDADLAELVLDEHDLLACKGLFDELLDKGGLTGAKEAGEISILVIV